MQLKTADVIEAVRISGSEIRKSRKYEHTQRCDVLLVHDTGMGEWHHGITDETGDYLFIPMIMRVWTELHPVVISPKERIYLVHNNNHCTIDLILLGRIAASVTYDMLIDVKVTQKLKAIMGYRWLYNTDVISVKVKKTPASINPQLFQNKYSASFSRHNFQTLQTKAFSFLDDVSNKTIFLVAAASGLFGIILGAGLMFIGILIIQNYA